MRVVDNNFLNSELRTVV